MVDPYVTRWRMTPGSTKKGLLKNIENGFPTIPIYIYYVCKAIAMVPAVGVRSVQYTRKTWHLEIFGKHL